MKLGLPNFNTGGKEGKQSQQFGSRAKNKTIGDMADEAFFLNSCAVIVILGLSSSPKESNSIEKAAKA